MEIRRKSDTWGTVQMIKRFEVENFKGFKDKLIFDLNARDYSFNRELVKDGIVNKAIIYGKNGIGKSSLGIALFDIVSHLTDKERMPAIYLSYYRNLEQVDQPVSFRYVFWFDGDEILYEYQKMDQDYLVRETLFLNGVKMLDYDYFDLNIRFVDRCLAGELNIDLVDNRLSVLKYIYRNTPTNFSPAITKMIQFCENMLWYRSLSEGNVYSGFTNGSSMLTERLYESGKIREFESFLRDNGIFYRLKFRSVNGSHELCAVYDDGKNMAPFLSLASTGTKALFLFYIWSISAFDKISLLFIDEFDAFFHYESAENIVLRLNHARGFQTILTTHNTYLMQNRLTRPDCCFLMTENRIGNLYDATDREIREAHNLEKMYINGAFKE